MHSCWTFRKWQKKSNSMCFWRGSNLEKAWSAKGSSEWRDPEQIAIMHRRWENRQWREKLSCSVCFSVSPSLKVTPFVGFFPSSLCFSGSKSGQHANVQGQGGFNQKSPANRSWMDLIAEKVDGDEKHSDIQSIISMIFRIRLYLT